MKRKQLLLSVTLILAVSVAPGCGKSTGTPAGQSDQPAVSHDPITLSVFLQAAVSDEDFKLLFADPVKKKYPYITLQLVRAATGTKIDDLIIAGTIPDIATAAIPDVFGFTRQDILYDINPLVKKYNIDLSRFEPATVDAVKSDKGEQWGLPYAVEFNTLYYNKDIFDKFGVSYPKDGMIWEDAIDLAKKMTRTVEGTKYRGLDVVNSNIMGFPFPTSYVNGTTNKANINNDQWKRVWELTKLIQTIPGNEPPSPEISTTTVANYFVKDKNEAMVVAPNMMKYFGEAVTAVNWDLAQYPSYKERPGISGKVDSHSLVITKQSKYKEDAIKVLQVVTSDEVQLLNVRKTSRVSPLKNPEMKTQYGADLDYLKGKNVQAIFKSKVVPAPVYSIYESDGSKIGKAKYKEFLQGTVPDVNTALLQAEDEINKMLATKIN